MRWQFRRASTFQQQARLAVTLAWVAGYTNVVALVASGLAVSNLTATTTRVGESIGTGDLAAVGLLGWVLGWFLLGAFVSGLLATLARVRGWGRVHGWPMAIEAVTLTVFAVCIEVFAEHRASPDEVMSGHLLWVTTASGCFSMGLQNATITRISGGVVRTTHVTGVITDLGLELAKAVVPPAPAADAPETPRGWRGWVATHQRLVLLSCILASFLFGGMLAPLAYRLMEGWMMFAPVAFLLWIIVQDRVNPIRGEAP